MRFFDFHVHPTLKCMFSTDQSKTNPWQEINPKIIPWVLRWCTEFEYILCTQAGLHQLTQEAINVICVPLFAPERGMTTDSFLLSQAKGTMSKLLNPDQLKHINDKATKPFDLVMDDLENVLLNAKRFGITDKRVLPLNKGVVYNENDNNTIFAAFTIEGAHSIASTFDKDKINLKDILINLDILRKKVPIISINITHLEQYPFCNHAFGILFVTSDQFKPTGNRISNDGFELIKECYKRNILIDMKHMSLASRRQFVEDIRKKKEIKDIIQPIVCTHVGFTGLSYADIPDYLAEKPAVWKDYSRLAWAKPKKYESNTPIAFNPSSINLYDEDIYAVLSSGGLIGLSLDKRILGFSEASSRPEVMNELIYEEEYISNMEKDVFLTKKFIGKKADEDNCIVNHEVLQGGVVNPDLGYYHLCHFMGHILHFIDVAKKFDYPVEKALTQICVGSDFDGIINPIWCCPTSLSMPDFKKQFIDEFPYFARANRDITKLPNNFDIHNFAGQLFFKNGFDFLMKRLKLI